jgi:alpha-1,6-mannosyltransferase
VKICDLALFSEGTSSGVKTYITNKIRYINAQPENIEHVLIVPSSEDRFEVQGRSRIFGVRGLPTFYPEIQLAINIGKIADIVEKEKPDLIEVNCQYTLPWAAFLATRRRTIPIVGVYHTDVPACARRFAEGAGPAVASAVEKITEFYEGIIYRHFTLTIALTMQMKGRLNRMGVDRIECLPCGVDISTFKPEATDPMFRQRHGLGPAQKILLYTGRLSPEKEVDLLCAAYERLCTTDYALVIAGDGPETPAIRKFAESHPHVRYLGHVASHAELAHIYAQSDVLIVPGRYETFCMSAVEALACGVPVVGIEGSGTATLVTTGVGALAQAGNADDLADKILTVANWPDFKCVRARCRSASERYSWDQVFEGYFRAYSRLIAEYENGLA